MSVLQESFLNLVQHYEATKDQLDLIREQLDLHLSELGVGAFVQDPATKVVYQVNKPEGHFVTYKQIGYVRTKKDNERQGTLSLKKAEEAGFTF